MASNKQQPSEYYYIEQDHNGLWFVLNSSSFPISQAFATREEAEVEQKRLEQYYD